MAFGKRTPLEKEENLKAQQRALTEGRKAADVERREILVKARMVHREIPAARVRALTTGDDQRVRELLAERDRLIGPMDDLEVDELLGDSDLGLDRDVPAGGELARVRQLAETTRGALASVAEEHHQLCLDEAEWFLHDFERAAAELLALLQTMEDVLDDAEALLPRMAAARKRAAVGTPVQMRVHDLSMLRSELERHQELARQAGKRPPVKLLDGREIEPGDLLAAPRA